MRHVPVLFFGPPLFCSGWWGVTWWSGGGKASVWQSFWATLCSDIFCHLIKCQLCFSMWNHSSCFFQPLSEPTTTIINPSFFLSTHSKCQCPWL